MRRCLIELVVLFSGCDVTGVVGHGFNPETEQLIPQTLRLGAHENVDILFVIDSTSDMAAKQAALRAALPVLTQQLPGRHYHFGVITSDLGAGPKGFGNCTAPGDDAILVWRSLCRPPDGVRFLDYDPAGTNNLPPSRDLSQALDCMLDVGESGCSFPQPLEAARRALVDQPVNAGFLRPDALLVVLFLTDQDDCSAPIDSSVFAEPHNTFRCTQAGVSCGFPPQPPSSNPDTPNIDCIAAPGGPLYDLSRYFDFFFSASGVKRDPHDVRVVLLAPWAYPLSVSQDSQGQDKLDLICGGSPDLVAYPAVRLHGLFDARPSATTSSICLLGTYEYALGTLINNSFEPTPACLSLPIADPEFPDCQVTIGDLPIPHCDPSEPGVCWELIESPDCVPIYNPRSKHGESLALTVRNSVELPTSASCTVIAPR